MNKDKLTNLVSNIQIALIESVSEEVRWFYEGDTLSDEESDWVRKNLAAVCQGLSNPLNGTKTSDIVEDILKNTEDNTGKPITITVVQTVDSTLGLVPTPRQQSDIESGKLVYDHCFEDYAIFKDTETNEEDQVLITGVEDTQCITHKEVLCINGEEVV